MSLIFAVGTVGAEARDELIHEGKFLYEQIRDEHFELARDKSIILGADGNVRDKGIPWMVEESVCIALASYARKLATVSE